MQTTLIVSEVRFVVAAREKRAAGLLGWASVVIYDSVHVDCIAVRRTREGRIALSFPERIDRHGQRHAVVRPRHARARLAIEREVIAVLRRRGYLA